jgi:glutathione S-transferase
VTSPAPRITLYDFEISAGCYKVRLLLSLLKLDYERVAVNFYPGFEHRQPAFLEINPLGQLPAIRDGDVVLRDAQAILTYLARKYDPAARWLPSEPAAFAEVMMWLFFAASELSAATAARLHAMLDFPADAAAVKQAARKAFRIMNDAMTAREHDGASWFVGEEATLADVALFPAIALSRDFRVEHDEYPALRQWMRRVRGLSGFIAMPGIPDYY